MCHFDGAAGSMEKEGVSTIFKRSVHLCNIRYKTYIGEGDTSSYQAMVKSKPYGEFIPPKDEGAWHVQKRVGSRLRKLLKAEDKLSGGRGKGKLNQRVIDSPQNRMGLAIHMVFFPQSFITMMSVTVLTCFKNYELTQKLRNRI